MRTKPVPFKLTDTDASHLENLKKLNEQQFALLISSEVESYHELSFMYGLPIGTIKSSLHRARQRIIKFRKFADDEKTLNPQTEPSHTEGQ